MSVICLFSWYVCPGVGKSSEAKVRTHVFQNAKVYVVFVHIHVYGVAMGVAMGND